MQKVKVQQEKDLVWGRKIEKEGHTQKRKQNIGEGEKERETLFCSRLKIK